MTEGPCGEVFKEAFSCFVYSKEEPKGADCLEQFSKMHECMVANIDHYGSGDEDESEGEKAEAKTEEKEVDIKAASSQGDEVTGEEIKQEKAGAHETTTPSNAGSQTDIASPGSSPSTHTETQSQSHTSPQSTSTPSATQSH